MRSTPLKASSILLADGWFVLVMKKAGFLSGTRLSSGTDLGSGARDASSHDLPRDFSSSFENHYNTRCNMVLVPHNLESSR
jgi:hypothetical protein